MSNDPPDPQSAGDPATTARQAKPSANPWMTTAAVIGAIGLLLLGVAAVRMAFGDGAEPTSGEPVTTAPDTPAAAVADDGAATTSDAVTPPARDGSPEAGMTQAVATNPTAPGEPAATETAGEDAAPAPLPTPSDAAAAIAKALGPAYAVVRVVEDWRAMASADDVEAGIERNMGIGENQLSLALLSPGAAPGPLPGLLLSWSVEAPPPNDFVGFNRDLPEPQAWTGATHLALWADPGQRPRGNFVVQFREGSDEVWRHETAAATLPTDGAYVVPLTDEAFAWAPWSRESNGRVDLEAVDRVGLYVGHDGPGLSGGLRLGGVAAVRRIDER